jgi:hypothetical protein
MTPMNRHAQTPFPVSTPLSAGVCRGQGGEADHPLMAGGLPQHSGRPARLSLLDRLTF